MPLRERVRENFTASRRMLNVKLVKNSRSACGIAVIPGTTYLTLTVVQAENGLAERILELEAWTPWTSCGAS
jgi:hypothetical protein